MHQNNLIYKGYRLTARVSRGAGAEVQALSSGPIFIASITVVQAGAVQDGGDEYPVPRFADGGYVQSARGGARRDTAWPRNRRRPDQRSFLTARRAQSAKTSRQSRVLASDRTVADCSRIATAFLNSSAEAPSSRMTMRELRASAIFTSDILPWVW